MAKLRDDATVAYVREHELEGHVVRATDLPATTVARTLRSAAGNSLLRNLFRDDWPTRTSVARVRNENLFARVATATGFSVQDVRLALEHEDGRANVSAVLSEIFDEADDGEGDYVPESRPTRRRRSDTDLTVHALIIGNEAYEHAPTLNNPAKDARDFARKATQLGCV